MNIKEAAEHLGISIKTLERKVAGGEIAVAYVPGATGKQRTFDRAELDSFKAAEAEKTVATTYVISRSRNSDAPSTHALQRAGGEQGMQAFALMIADALRGAGTPGNGTRGEVSVSDLAHKLMLSIEEAAALAGLSAHHVREAIKAGALKAKIVGRGYRVKRPDLDAYVKKL